MDELVAIFDEIDFKQFRQNPWEITNFISNMAYQEKSKAQAVKLFKRAWEDMPDQRNQLMQNMHHDAFWELPEMYDYAKQTIIPSADSRE